MGPGAQIDLLPRELTRAASHTLADAFQEDPLLRIVAPDRAKRERIAPWFMGLPVEYGARWGRVYGNADASAVAVWLPPGASTVSPVRMLRVGMAAAPVRIGLSATRRFFAALGATEEFHKEVEGPHWYLVAVGTRPALQGRGFGSALVEAGTAQADAAGVPCYLETATDQNIAFYSRRGFEVIGQAEVEGFTLTGMVRPPA